MLDRDEINKQLKDKSGEQCVAFAVRAAMRVLPLLASQKHNNEAFWFWKPKDRAKHLLAVCQAYGWSVQCVLDKNFGLSADARAANAANAAARAARAADADAAARAADAADAADAAARAADVADVSRAAAYAAYTADAAYTAAAYARAAARAANSSIIIQELEADLAALNHISAAALLLQPLWSQVMPDPWPQWLEDFEKDALSLNAGFEVWLDWYDDHLQGKPGQSRLNYSDDTEQIIIVPSGL